MSLKTRCPACDTVFKIVPDQLKVSSGWVRCGRCAEVFDASAHAVTTDESTLWPQINPPQVSETTANFIENTPPQEIKSIAIKPIKSKAKDDLFISQKKPETNSKTNLSFVRIANSKAFWQRPLVTRSLWAACTALLGLLLLQVFYSQRSYFAASSQTLKSGLESICISLGCQIEPYKNIDAFKIDSSSFQKTRIVQNIAADITKTNTYDLKVTIKNNATLPVAIPAVELTLTDAADKPVLRRVLLAQDMGFKDQSLNGNTDWSGAVSLTVTANSAMPIISGYRVLLFYP